MVSGAALASRTVWMFDMDGTLTVAAHDFDAMRQALDLPAGVPILEALDALPLDESRRKRAELDAMELDMAAHSREQPGAGALLDTLRSHGYPVGIVTRNGRQIADATLQAAGLAAHFAPADIVSRDCALAKPDPAGVQLLLTRWHARARDAVMVGDYRFDLAAGRAAGCLTVHLNVGEGERWPQLTDVEVDSLTQLASLLEAPGGPAVNKA